MLNPIAFTAINNVGTLYYHQSMKDPDANGFQKAIIKEVNVHVKRNHWNLIPREQVPTGEQILPYAWSLKWNIDIKYNQVSKHKMILNIHGSKQEYAVNLFETSSPVVIWFTINLVLVLYLINGCITCQMDFVLAFSQPAIEFDMYMEINQIV